jgi:DEAD/DEAH box helicase domain-containing protein
LDTVDLETLPWERETTGLWIDVPKPTLELMDNKGIKASEAIHAAQHAFLNCFVMGADLKTECKVAVKEYKTTKSRRQRPGRQVLSRLLV